MKYFQKKVLKNGLKIISIPQKSSKAVTVLILVGTGSKYETKEENGISHFLEHMFFKGTQKRPNTVAIAETLDQVGGIYNAFTGEEYTGYFAKVDAKHFDLALDWVSDIFLNSKLESVEMERERGVITEEINMIFDQPSAYVQTLWNKLLYGDQPAGWDIAGTKETVAGLQRENLVNYLKSQYSASNAIVCASGGIKSDAVTKITKIFSKMKGGPIHEKPKVKEVQQLPQCLLMEKKTDQTHFCFGVRAFDIFHPAKYSQEVLAAVLGGMMSSRLFIKVRERMGLAYHISADISSNTDTGSLVVQAGVDNSKAERAILAVQEEFKRMSEELIPAKELKKAKDCLKGKLILGLESSDAQASFYGMQELLEKNILTIDKICDKIDKVTSNDVLRVAKEIFKPQNLNLAIIGPFKDKETFSKLLKL